jgi:hypothetical protein
LFSGIDRSTGVERLGGLDLISRRPSASACASFSGIELSAGLDQNCDNSQIALAA